MIPSAFILLILFVIACMAAMVLVVMKGTRYTILELLIVIIVSSLPMQWIITWTHDKYPNDVKMLGGGVVTGILLSGSIMFGCYLGLQWASRRKVVGTWSRIALLMLGGALIPDIFGCMGCVIGIIATIEQHAPAPGRIARPLDIDSLLVCTIVLIIFLILGYLCWSQEQKARRFESR